MSEQIGSASIGLAVDSSGVDAGLNQMDATVTRVGRSLRTLGRTGAVSIEELGTGAGRANTSVSRATRNIQNEIQRVTAVAEAGARGTRAYYEALANQRGVSIDTLRPYIDRLEEVRRKQAEIAQQAADSGSAYDNSAQSVAQLNANLRNVPAQLTDIVAGLQGGQSPFTILLQQGGQLTDMFGSVEAAARALGGYVRSLITPVTGVAAAVAVLAVAYNQGSKEIDSYNLGIIKTGNAAGVTSGQLDTLAAKAAKVAGTQGANAEALAALVATGQVGADQLLKATTATVLAQKFLGESVDDTAQAYADLGKDPVAGILKLNEGLNFLNLATYKQIQDLQEQGRVTEAAKLAQETYSTALTGAGRKMEGSLGNLQKSWNFVGGAAKWAWDKMLDVGREDTLDNKLKRAQERLERAKASRYSFIGSDVDKARIQEEAQNDVDRLERQKFVNKLTAERTAEEKRRFDAQKQFDQEGDKYLSRREQMTKEITRVTNLAAQAKPVGLDAEQAVKYEKDVQERITQIKATYADINNASIESQIANVERLADAQEAAAQRLFIPAQRDQDAGLNTAADKQIAFMEKVARYDEEALLRERARLQQRLALTAQLGVSQDQQAEKDQQMADLRAQIGAKDEQLLTRRAQLQADLFVQDVNTNRAAIKAMDDLLDARTADADAIQRQLEAQKDENAALGLTRTELQALTTQRVEERAVRLESNADILDTIVGREAEADAMRKSARLLRELNQEQIKGANKAQAIDTNKKFWESVDNTAQAAFTNIFEGGKSVSDRLRDAFKAGILDLLYQMTVKKWIIDISTSTSGSSLGSIIGGSLNSSAGSSGGSGLIGTAGNLLSAGKLIYQGFTTGFVGSMGASITSLGNLFGSQAVSAFGAGMSGGALGASTASAASGYAGTTAAGAGASAASAIPIIGWIITGMMASNSLYKQGWDSHNGSVSDIGDLLGGNAARWSDLSLQKMGMSSSLANIFSGQATIAKLFGRKNPEIESSGLSGTITGSDVNAMNYANIIAKGGYFRSDKRWQEKAQVSDEANKFFDGTMGSLITAVKGYGAALGIEANTIDSYTKSFDIKSTGDAAKDNEAIKALFTTVADDLSLRLVPGLAAFSMEGEAASTTLQRLTTNYVNVDTMLTAIGQSIKLVGVTGIEARERLIAAAGSLDTLANGATFFQQNFLSEAERIAPVQKQVADTMAAMGLSSVKTNDQFKAAALGLDLNTKAGADLFAQMLALAPAFKTVTDYTNALTGTIVRSAEDIREERKNLQNQLDQAIMSPAKLAEKARAAIDASNLALYDQVQAANAVVAAKAALASAYSTEAAAAKDALERSRTWVATLNGLNDSLALSSFSVLTPQQQYAEAQAQFEKTLAAANAGDENARAGLDAAQQAFLTTSQVVNGANAKYSADYARVVAANEDAAKWAASQVDLQQASYNVLEAQVKGLVEVNKSVLTVAQAITNLQSALDVSAVKGINFDGSHAGGLTSVPFNGYAAELHRGEVVIDAQAAAAMRRYFGATPSQGGANTDALVAEIKTLRAVVEGLRVDQARQAAALAQSNDKAAQTVVVGVQKSAAASAWASTVKGEYT